MTFANYILQLMYPTCEPPANAIRLIATIIIRMFNGLIKIDLFANFSILNWQFFSYLSIVTMLNGQLDYRIHLHLQKLLPC